MSDVCENISTRYNLLLKLSNDKVFLDQISPGVARSISVLRQLLMKDFVSISKKSMPGDFIDIYEGLHKDIDVLSECCFLPELSNKFSIAFGGGFSAGKSSLINMLIGERLLVAEVDPTTSLPTYLLKGNADRILAKNVFDCMIDICEEEFSVLTHDETSVYGGNVSRLLNSVFVTRRNFPWENLIFIDTPGYSEFDNSDFFSRNDEEVAFISLNAANAVVWAIDAQQGCITENDLKFLSEINLSANLLFVVSRADKKTEEEIKNIVDGIRLTLKSRKISFVDVVVVSDRSKKWPKESIVKYIDAWNDSSKKTELLCNFKHNLMRYKIFLESEIDAATKDVSKIDHILAVSEDDFVRKSVSQIRRKINKKLLVNKKAINNFYELLKEFSFELDAISRSTGLPVCGLQDLVLSKAAHVYSSDKYTNKIKDKNIEAFGAFAGLLKDLISKI